MKNKLTRSENKMVGGVLAGLADYYGHDQTIWRLGFICFLILTGLMPGVLMYVVGYVVMPEREAVPDVAYRVVEE